MDDQIDEKSQLETFLKASGWGPFILSLKFVRNREYSRVWVASVHTSVGELNVELLVYQLEEDPGLVVEYEEEKATLKYFATLENRWPLAPEIVLEGRTQDFGVLVTASRRFHDPCTGYLDHLFRKLAL